MKFAIRVVIAIALLVVASRVKINVDTETTMSGPSEAMPISISVFEGQSASTVMRPIEAFHEVASKGLTTIQACENSGGYPSSNFSNIKIERQLSQGGNVISDKTDGFMYLATGFSTESKPTTLLGAVVRYFLPSQPVTVYNCVYPLTE